MFESKKLKFLLLIRRDPPQKNGYQAKKVGLGIIVLERTYKPHYHYQNFSPLANGTDLNREKYAILQTHWH